MRIDRLLRAGPFREGLLPALKELLASPSLNLKVITKDHYQKGEEAWQAIKGNSTMNADGLTHEARTLFVLLLICGAKPAHASKFVLSLRSTHASLTFPILKFNTLLSAKHFILDKLDDVSLMSYVRREMTRMDETKNTGLIYLEIACRSLMAVNAHIMGSFHDEVIVEGRPSTKKPLIPMKMMPLASSQFLLLRKHESGAIMVEHCSNSSLLSNMIAEDIGAVEGLIQQFQPATVFKATDARRRWVYKQIILALLGSSQGLWVRVGGQLSTVLDASFLKEDTTYKKRASFSSFFPVLTSPIRSDISESEWIRAAATGRINRIGASVINSSWEFEIVSVEGIAELPALDPNQKWLIVERDAKSGERIFEVRFITLSLDSPSVRRVRVEEIGMSRAATEEVVEIEPVVIKPVDDRKEESIIERQVETGNVSSDVLTASEGVQLIPLEKAFNALDTQMREIISTKIREKGEKSPDQSLDTYVTAIYDEAGMEGFLANNIPEWTTRVSDFQKKLLAKQTRILIASMYGRAFIKGALDEKGK